MQIRPFSRIPQGYGLPASSIRISVIETTVNIIFLEGQVFLIPSVIVAFRVEEDGVVNDPETTVDVAVSVGSFPNHFVLKLILAENLVEHEFDVVAGMPIAVIVEAASFLEHAMQLDAAQPHVVDIDLGRRMTIFEASLPSSHPKTLRSSGSN